MILTAPFQVADEHTHFDRVYQLSELETVCKIENNALGAYIPASFGKLASDFRYLSWQPNNKVTKNQIFKALRVPLNKSQKSFQAINASGYFYFSYIPQLPVMVISKWFNFNTLVILYLGRLSALLFFISCLRYALIRIPFAKYLLATVALMPMCLAQAASFNADCVIFSLSFLGVALVLKKSFETEPFKLDLDFYILVGISLIYGVLKPTYLPLAFLLIALIARYVRSNRKLVYLLTGTLILSSLLTYGWRHWFSSGSNPVAATNVSVSNLGVTNKDVTLFQNPKLILELVHNSFLYFKDFYFKSTIGILGYLDTSLPTQVYSIFTFLIFFLLLFDFNKNYSLKIGDRLLFFICGFGVVLLTIIGMYGFTREEAGLVAEGVQGRYFIPALMPIFLMINGILPFKIDLMKYKSLNVVIYLAIIYSLYLASSTLKTRYFG
jgi:uncharacterized membrane protein